jgi:hypothetical protein
MQPLSGRHLICKEPEFVNVAAMNNPFNVASRYVMSTDAFLRNTTDHQ